MLSAFSRFSAILLRVVPWPARDVVVSPLVSARELAGCLLPQIVACLQAQPSFSEYPLHMQEKLGKVAWYEE